MLTRITNTPRDYAWGTPGGISALLGLEATDDPQAELWLGAHPSSPSRAAHESGWADLREWETQSQAALPYLLKILSAAKPLSLQAHPTPVQAAEGFAREEAAGIPIDARERSYKDPHAKPELIVAVSDTFEALCGFRPVGQALEALDVLVAASETPAVFEPWRDRLVGSDPVRAAFTWLLSGDADVAALIAALPSAAARLGDDGELVARIDAAFPGDPGLAVALMLNHVVLQRGECLWLPAGNIHSYLCGTGIELMGPSDNVLRGGLTPKHVDVTELGTVLDFTDGPPPRLEPVPVAAHVTSYRPSAVPSGEGIPFELLAVTGPATLSLRGPSILAAIAGEFTVSGADGTDAVARGDFVFTPGEPFTLAGAGRLFVATASSP